VCGPLCKCVGRALVVATISFEGITAWGDGHGAANELALRVD
jgi:hypothetical protein